MGVSDNVEQCSPAGSMKNSLLFVDYPLLLLCVDKKENEKPDCAANIISL